MNKLKRVLILEAMAHDPLAFAPVVGSDSLSYSIEVRKRGHGGHYEENRVSGKNEEAPRRERQSFDLAGLEKSNPNLSRNLELLFPKKVGERREPVRSKQSEYEDKLKGLRSVMNEISIDLGEVEPTIRESRGQQGAEPNLNQSPEW
ncbi:unnamed protein product [Sphagnum balticum]